MRGVDKIYSTTAALAVVLKDTTVVTMGGKYDGGLCSNLKATLRGVDKIFSTANAMLQF